MTPETGSHPTTLYFMVLFWCLYRCFPVHVPAATGIDIACPLYVIIPYLSIPSHLVSKRIRRKKTFYSLKRFIHLSHKTLRLRQSFVSTIKAKCCMKNRHYLLRIGTALALISLLPGQIPAGNYHLFMISVSFFFFFIYFFSCLNPTLRIK